MSTKGRKFPNRIQTPHQKLASTKWQHTGEITRTFACYRNLLYRYGLRDCAEETKDIEKLLLQMVDADYKSAKEKLPPTKGLTSPRK